MATAPMATAPTAAAPKANAPNLTADVAELQLIEVFFIRVLSEVAHRIRPFDRARSQTRRLFPLNLRAMIHVTATVLRDGVPGRSSCAAW